MYNIDQYKFGQAFRTARKAKRLTASDLANKINKSKTTIYKYERDEVLPDILTVLEICNVLEISFDDLMNKKSIEVNSETSINPFPTDELYLYYKNSNMNTLAEMKLVIKSESGFMKVYFYINETDTLFYVGTIESNLEIAFINLKNYYVVNPRFEKVMLMLNMQYSSDERKYGIIIGLKSDINMPVIKKCVVLKHKITEEEKQEILQNIEMNKEEIEQINKDKFWYPDIRNNFGFKGI